MKRATDYARTMTYLHSTPGYERFSHSWERHANGAHTIDLAPAQVEQDLWTGQDTAYPMLTLRFNDSGVQTYPARHII